MESPMMPREDYTDVGTIDAEDRPRRLDLTIVEALTDASHAHRFAEAYGDVQLKHNHRRGIWFVYRHPRWRPDCDGEVYPSCLGFCAAPTGGGDRDHRPQA